MSRIDRIALVLSITAGIAAFLVADRVYERMAHFEDEMAYVWQAEVIAKGHLTLPSPTQHESLLVPFVIDYHGQRFGKYPPGWPTVLAGGIALGLRDWVNPLLAVFGVWFTYRLGKKLASPQTGLLASALLATSPLFLLLSGSLLSHAWSLLLTAAFVVAWLDTLSVDGSHSGANSRLTLLVAGLTLGVLAITRPITAIGVGTPFAFHGLYLLWTGDRATRTRVLMIGLVAGAVSALLFAWQFAVTGNPFLNPYVLWWPYDKYGFGVGYGRFPEGHNLDHAWLNLKYTLTSTGGDFFGWGKYYWIFAPFGLWSMRRKPGMWLTAGIFPALILVYIPYWIGSWEYGPRYYYEGMLGLTIVSASGILWLANIAIKNARLWIIPRVVITMLVVGLAGYNLSTYLPARLMGMVAFHNISRSQLQPFQTQQARDLAPALFIVHFQKEWTEYGGLLTLENADLTSPFIFALSKGRIADNALRAAFPNRRVFDYYTDEPFTFYTSPR
jgi:hypothetical protein